MGQRVTKILQLMCATAMVLIGQKTWAAASLQIVPKWTSLEREFRSGVRYESPLSNCRLAVELTSPSGDKQTNNGFWDGGRTWRFRFQPDRVGLWRYRTFCSDPQNRQLQTTGEFLCTAPAGDTLFRRRGPVQPDPRARQFRHQDGTPFFWMADTLNSAALKASPEELQIYAKVRAQQQFSVVHLAFTGADAFSDLKALELDLEFFKETDALITLLNRNGLMCALALDASSLSLEARLALIHYTQARWQAWNVAWITTTSSREPRDAPVRGAFNEQRGALVVRSVESPDLNAHSWSDAVLARERSAARPGTAQPLLIQLPRENSITSGATRVTADTLRREAWTQLLGTSASGIVYSAAAVADWNATVSADQILPLWHRSLFLPGAKQLQVLQRLARESAMLDLKPLASEHGSTVLHTALAAAQSEDKSEGWFYTTSETLELSTELLPDIPVLQWLDPRTGISRDAVAVVGATRVKIPTPGPGDWLLVVRSSKAPPHHAPESQR